MVIFQAVLDALVGISWPLALAGVALLFRAEIKAKFGDIEKAGPDGITFRGQQATMPAADVESKKLIFQPSSARTPFRRAVEESIVKDLDILQENARIPTLIDRLVDARLSRAFEIIWSNIFGSQVEELRKINDVGGSMALSEVEKHFEEIKEIHNEFYDNATFSQWFRFFEVNQLAFIENGSVIIQDAGREFLLYISVAKGSDIRPY